MVSGGQQSESATRTFREWITEHESLGNMNKYKQWVFAHSCSLFLTTL